MPENVTCLRCIPIRIGVIILGVLGILGSLESISSGFSQIRSASEFIPEEDFENEDVSTSTGIGRFVIGIIHLVLSITLLKGVKDRNPSRLRLWVKYNIGTLALVGGLFLIFVIFIISVGAWILIFPLLVYFAVIAGWDAYCIYVVHTFAGIMEAEERREFSETEVAYEKV